MFSLQKLRKFKGATQSPQGEEQKIIKYSTSKCKSINQNTTIINPKPLNLKKKESIGTANVKSNLNSLKMDNMKKKLDNKWKLYNKLSDNDSKDVNISNELKLLAYSRNPANEDIGYNLNSTISEIQKRKRKYKERKRLLNKKNKTYSSKKWIKAKSNSKEMYKEKNIETENSSKIFDKKESKESESKFEEGDKKEAMETEYISNELSHMECIEAQISTGESCKKEYIESKNGKKEYIESENDKKESDNKDYMKTKSNPEEECIEIENEELDEGVSITTDSNSEGECIDIENDPEIVESDVEVQTKYERELDEYKYIKLTSEKSNINLLNTIPLMTKEDNLYLSLKPIGNNTLYVALFPDTKIYLYGYYHLHLLLGCVSVLGYKFKEGEKHVIYCPKTHSVSPINVLSGSRVKSLSDKKLKELKIPIDWVKHLPIGKDQLIVIAKLRRYESNMTRILNISKMVPIPKNESFNVDIWEETIGVQLQDPNKTQLRMFSEPDSWTEAFLELKPLLEKKAKICIVVTGGQSVGKSTFVKFMINQFLSTENVPEVACLDLDPGQPEFALTSVLSLSKITSPILGPSYAHRDTTKFSFMKKFLLGDVNVQHVLQEYIDGVRILSHNLQNFDQSIPVICNTMGFTADIGLDIMVDIIKLIEPTHVINIISSDRRRNFRIPLYDDIISQSNRGITQQSFKNLTYHFMNIQQSTGTYLTKPNKILRDINIMAYFSKLWNDNEVDISGESIRQPVKIDWCNIAIHVLGSFVPKTHIMQAINASLVALCQIENEYLEKIDINFPLRIQDGILWNKYCKCLGWGIVKGIDPEKREIHLLTYIGMENLLELNLLILPKVYLPKEFYNLFYHDGAPYWVKV